MLRIHRHLQPSPGQHWLVLACSGVLLGVGILLIASEVGAGSHRSTQPETPSSLERARGECFSVPAPHLLDWPTSAVWDDDQVLFADVLRRGLLLVEPTTSNVNAEMPGLDFVGQGQPEDLSVIRALPGGDGFLVEDEGSAGADGVDSTGDRLLKLDVEMNVVGILEIAERELTDGWILDSIYDWQPALVAGGELGVLAFGDLKKAGPSGFEWESGLVWIRESSERGTVLRFFDEQSAASYQHSQELGYLATAGSWGFMLVYESEPYLLSVELDGSEQQPQEIEIPPALRHRPAEQLKKVWKRTRGPARVSAYLEVLESSSGVASIFARGEQLFLMGRVRRDVGPGVDWHVIELAADGTELAQAPLPVSRRAHHLIPAIGSGSHLGFLERSQVERLGEGQADAPYLAGRNMVFLPSAWIEDLDSGQMAKAWHRSQGSCS